MDKRLTQYKLRVMKKIVALKLTNEEYRLIIGKCEQILKKQKNKTEVK